MQPHDLVANSPSLDQDLRFRQRVTDLSVEQLVAQLSVQTLD